MTPGEAALRNAPAAFTPASAAFRLSMSASGAAGSSTPIGAVQAGVRRRAWRPGPRVCRLPAGASRIRTVGPPPDWCRPRGPNHGDPCHTFSNGRIPAAGPQVRIRFAPARSLLRTWVFEGRISFSRATTNRLPSCPDDRYSSIARLKEVRNFGILTAQIRDLSEASYYAGLRKAGMPEEWDGASRGMRSRTSIH
jgi:hypothetical protein